MSIWAYFYFSMIHLIYFDCVTKTKNKADSLSLPIFKLLLKAPIIQMTKTAQLMWIPSWTDCTTILFRLQPSHWIWVFISYLQILDIWSAKHIRFSRFELQSKGVARRTCIFGQLVTPTANWVVWATQLSNL